MVPLIAAIVGLLWRKKTRVLAQCDALLKAYDKFFTVRITSAWINRRGCLALRLGQALWLAKHAGLPLLYGRRCPPLAGHYSQKVPLKGRLPPMATKTPALAEN